METQERPATYPAARAYLAAYYTDCAAAQHDHETGRGVADVYRIAAKVVEDDSHRTAAEMRKALASAMWAALKGKTAPVRKHVYRVMGAASWAGIR